MKWPHHRNLRNRPPTPSKGRGPVQVRIRRAFMASGAEVLSSTQIYDWTHSRRRQSRRKKLPFGVFANFGRSGQCVIQSSLCRRMARGCGDCAARGLGSGTRC
jgi:hypothetical protein